MKFDMFSVFLFLAFFFWGMHLVYFAFAFSSLLLLFFLLKYRVCFDFNLTFLFLIFNFFILIVYGYGSSNFIPELSWNTVFIIVFFSAFTFFLFSNTAIIKNDDKQLILFYSLGLVAKVLITIYYSINLDFFKYGYGLLFDPFTNKEVNSPSYANALVFTLPILLYKFRCSFFYFFLIFLVVISGIYLGSRTFIFLFMLSIIVWIYNESRFRTFVYTIMCSVTFLFILGGVFFEEISDLTIFKRINDIGLETSRFKLYGSALEELYYSPMGWYGIDQSVEKTLWYHNLWLDTSRVSGLCGLFILLFFMIFTLVNWKNKHYVYLMNYLLIVLICSQDVIIEGNTQALMFLYLNSLIIVRREKKRGLE